MSFQKKRAKRKSGPVSKEVGNRGVYSTTESCSMSFFLRVYEFNELRSRAALVPLTDAEETKLAALTTMLEGDERPLDERRVAFRLRSVLDVSVSIHGAGVKAAGLRDLSARGFGLELKSEEQPGRTGSGIRDSSSFLHAPNVGTRIVVHVEDRTSGDLFDFPGVVMWSAGSRFGVRLEGIPARRPNHIVRTA